MSATTPYAIVLFDGVCNLCNAAVQFILKHDPKGYFHFASLQSEVARELLAQYGERPDQLETLIVITPEGKVLKRSAAAFGIARHLTGGWRHVAKLGFLPRFLTDFFYRLISQSRYTLFGKRDHCMIPRPEWKERFLEE